MLGSIFFLCTTASRVQAFTFPQKLTTSFVGDGMSSFFSPVHKSAGVLYAGRGGVSTKSYEYDGWNLTYRYKPASPGYEKYPALLLIHPVGVGISSWFWGKFLKAWTGPDVYAPNLIGCGVSEGGDPWDPGKRGLSVPLGWAKGCEALMKEVMSSRSLEGNGESLPWLVFAQGGLAPVGILIAARNPTSVKNLILSSPPTWKEMTTPVPESELARNFKFLKSPILGNLAFTLLESRRLIEFFSNQFLFSTSCDDIWLDQTEKECGRESRPPIILFNSGFCMHRSFEEELRTLHQPTLILVGQDDKRKRDQYLQLMKDCKVKVLPGQNVLPWESPKEVVEDRKSVV